MKKFFSLLILLGEFLVTTMAQEDIYGFLINEKGQPIKGAIVCDNDNPSVNVITNENGSFLLKAENCEFIKIKYKDSKEKRVKVPDDKNMGQIILDKLMTIIDLGNNQTTEYYKTQSTTLIDADVIDKNSSFYIQNVLWGITPSGIRGDKYDKLLIVDGFPRSWEYLSNQAIESIVILKDAPGKALWGARGANGVIVVTTKRGVYKSKSIDMEYIHGVGLPTDMPEMADATAYARSLNEALYYDGLPLRYSNDDINQFSSGQGDPDLYPNTNWLKEGLRTHTHNNQFNLNLRGGGHNVRYFSSTNYKNNFGILNTGYTNFDSRYSSQIRSYRLSSQMNLDFNITETTIAKLNLLGLLRENINPTKNNANIFAALINVPSAAFPVRTENNLWGSNYIFNSNPIADIAALGFSKTNERLLQADFTLTQNLTSLLQGLSAEIGIAYDNSLTYLESQTKKYAYEVNEKIVNEKKSMTYGTETNLDYDSSLADQFMRTGLKFKVSYDKLFAGKHHLNINSIYGQESLVELGRNNTWKRQYILGTFGYNYVNRYLLDVVLNYYGTSVLKKGNRFTLYPAVSAAWTVSNEPFFYADAIDFLKIRLSAGQSGLDNLPYEIDKSYWIYGSSYFFRDANTIQGGTKEGPLPAINLKNERSTDGNIGVDLKLFKHLTFSVDGFYRRKDNIRVSGNAVYSSVLGITIPNVFEGVTDTKGGEISLTWQKERKDFSYYVQGNFTFARTKIIENNEGYQPYNYLYRKGHPFGQFFGLEAIGYFNDWEDINSSPRQVFSEVRPGDIKYRDVNRDEVIDEYDVVANGYSTYMPEIYYGLRIGFSYRNLGFDITWQGVTNYSVVLNTPSIYWPLRNNTNISYWYLNDRIRWTEETKAVANVPRLTTLDNANNFRNSTQWLEDGSYLSLRNVNIYYDLPTKLIKTIGLNACQIYLRANNLLLFDKIKYLNPENLTMSYPNLKSMYLGVNIKF